VTLMPTGFQMLCRPEPGAVMSRQNAGDRGPADSMADALQRAEYPRVAPRRIVYGHPTTSRRISATTPGRPPRRLAYVHLRAMRCRCQRRIVSGVTIVAMHAGGDAQPDVRAPRADGVRRRSDGSGRARVHEGCGFPRSGTPQSGAQRLTRYFTRTQPFLKGRHSSSFKSI
jgi:hypothetical protein